MYNRGMLVLLTGLVITASKATPIKLDPTNIETVQVEYDRRGNKSSLYNINKVYWDIEGTAESESYPDFGVVTFHMKPNRVAKSVFVTFFQADFKASRPGALTVWVVPTYGVIAAKYDRSATPGGYSAQFGKAFRLAQITYRPRQGKSDSVDLMTGANSAARTLLLQELAAGTVRLVVTPATAGVHATYYGAGGKKSPVLRVH